MENYIPVIGGTYIHPDRAVSSQLCSNLYPSDVERGGKVERVLLPSQGYKQWRSINSTSSFSLIRGIHYSSTGVNGVQTVYIATGNQVLRVTQSTALGGVFTCGSISEGTTPVYFADNGFDLMVVDGSNAYECSLTEPNLTVNNTWKAVTLPTIDGTPIKPSNIFFAKQRFFIDSGKNQFWYSNLASTTFEQENFASAELKADYIVSMALVGTTALLLGNVSCEFWSVDGNPIAPVDGSLNDIGIMALASLATINDVAYWLGASKAGRFTVFASNGGAPKRISDDGVETIISKLSQPSGARAFCFYDKGHAFYVLNFVIDKITLVYDQTTNEWHNRSNVDSDTGITLSWQPSCITTAYNGLLLAGSSNSNELLELSSEIFTHGTQPIIRKWVAPVVWDNLSTIQIKTIQLDISVGSTTIMEESNGEGNVNPVVMARFSKDGGFTFSDQVERRLGKQGEYDTQPPQWHGIGIVKTFIPEFIISASIKFSIRGIKLLTGKVVGL